MIPMPPIVSIWVGVYMACTYLWINPEPEENRIIPPSRSMMVTQFSTLMM